MGIVDSHCHLNMLKSDTESVTERLQAARARGVEKFLCISVDLETFPDVIAYADEHEDVYASLGIHPLHPVVGLPVTTQFAAKAQHPKVVAIGETGLDYFYAKELAQQKTQQELFAFQLTQGKELGLPVIVHTREAQEDTLALIRQYGSTETAGVLHCFTENWEMASKAIDLGYYISFSGILTFRNAETLREVARKVPLERILVETDSPYLAPVPYRGKENEPKFVYEVAQCLADLRQMPLEKIAHITTDNFHRLFSKAQ
ncbi:TatD family hydrolase [Pokkaliibacter sp. CJK22405]|uniref:TatD family hydrolase n=1 Tax=Pokkaliibacter sp. CJK22405 TaxID=3384615 RepID=UPI00398541F9